MTTPERLDLRLALLAIAIGMLPLISMVLT